MAITQIKSSNIEDGTIVAADIADDSITNADIKSDAAIAASKLAGSIPASKLASTLDLSGKTVTLPAASVTAHAVAAEIGFSNVSGWADSAVKTVTLSPTTAIGKAQVAVWEEVPFVGQTTSIWDIITGDLGFDLIDSAYAVTLTPAAITGGSIAFTLGSGSWATTDIGKIIKNVSTSEVGEARIISIASAVATCTITINFTDTNAIASGDWELYSGEFVSGGFELGSSSQAGPPVAGTEVDFEAGGIYEYDLCRVSATKALVSYRDNGNSNYGTAIILAISGSTITPGTAVVFESALTQEQSVTALSSTQVMVAYLDGGNSDAGTACILNISGSTITPGTPFIYSSAATYDSAVEALTSTKAIVVYANSGVGKSVILNVSGSTITAGTVFQFNAATIGFLDITKLTTTKAIVVYRVTGVSATARILDVSGSTITGGTVFNYDSGNGGGRYNSVTRLTDTKVVVCWRRNSNTFPYTCVLDVATSTISKGATVQIAAVASNNTDVTYLTSTKAMVVYHNESTTYLTRAILDIATSTITVNTPAALNTLRATDNPMIAYISPDKVIVIDSAQAIARIVDMVANLYVTSQYVTTISGTDSLDTTFYDDLNSVTTTETLNGGTANYAFSVNSTPSAVKVTGGTFFVIGSGQTVARNIASSLTSAHGGVEGTWYINNNVTYASSTWVASATNEAKSAIEEATAIASNVMSGTSVNAVADANWPVLGTQFSVAITLYTTSTTISPNVDGVSLNYDGNVINRLETDAYTVEMPSTAAIKVTAPSSGGPRNARIYVSS